MSFYPLSSSYARPVQDGTYICNSIYSGPLLHEKQLSPHYEALTMIDFNVLADKIVLTEK